jgi:chemotaxis receptor (MCP) glutamine deamidase CheD
LGASIGITFWRPKLRVGALCHPLLPYCPTDLTAEKRLVTGCRYVDFSIRQLAWQFDRLDVSRGEVQVKVFGGAEAVGIGAAAKSAIGKLNSEARLRYWRPRVSRSSHQAWEAIWAGRSNSIPGPAKWQSRVVPVNK